MTPRDGNLPPISSTRLFPKAACLRGRYSGFGSQSTRTESSSRRSFSTVRRSFLLPAIEHCTNGLFSRFWRTGTHVPTAHLLSFDFDGTQSQEFRRERTAPASSASS